MTLSERMEAGCLKGGRIYVLHITYAWDLSWFCKSVTHPDVSEVRREWLQSWEQEGCSQMEAGEDARAAQEANTFEAAASPAHQVRVSMCHSTALRWAKNQALV